MITDVITIEMLQDSIGSLYRIGNTLESQLDRRAIAIAIGILEAELEAATELDQFTNEQVAKVEAYNSGNN
jgi:hypothetical protein